MMRKINQATIALIKEYEGCRLESYRDPVGIWTIGYGLTTAAGQGPVGAGMIITQDQADDFLSNTLREFAAEIGGKITAPASPNQFGAMLSLAYNIGTTAFSKSTCLRRFNAGDTEGAAEALTWFNKAGGKVLNGLVRRRAAEHELMLTEIEGAILVAAKPDAERDNPVKSTTIIASATTAVTGASGVATAVSRLDGNAQIIVIVTACVAALGLAWIARERLRKWAGGDR